ncbi:MAG: response regulator, partial [Caulobacteraceae bacterium]|nr:response regulator [Caulobacteraceae bacterium]
SRDIRPRLQRRDNGAGESAGVISHGDAIAASALEAAGVAAFRWDPRTGLIDLDACGRAMLGLPASGALGMADLLGLVAVEDRDQLAPVLGATIADAPFCVEARVQPLGRPERILLVRGCGRQGAFVDVTERPISGLEPTNSSARQAVEQELRRSAAELEQKVAERTAERDRLWRYSRDIMLVMDTQGTALSCNHAVTRILGWAPEEVVGRNVIELIHPEDHAAVVEALTEVVGRDTVAPVTPTAESDVFDIRCRRKDGGFDWISWTGGYEQAEGRTLYLTGRLVTGEKAAAAELSLAQEALRQSQKLEAMGQLTGGVAHDFNNLLTPIIGGLDMLQRREVGGEREQRLIDGALQSAERAKVLVQRLLAFARRQPLQPTAIDVASLFVGMKELIASTAGPRIRLEFDVETDLPSALADANQLEMALLNLAVNARDAMPDGGVLAISANLRDVREDSRHNLPPGEYVVIGVADTGVGMDEETLRRCIEPFYSTKGVGRGTGLGLSMVHGLASQLGGALEIDSAPGHGARVRLWLPVSVVAAPDAVRPVWTPHSLSVRGRALVVDDEDLVRASTCDMLVELGYEVDEASCADDALRMVEAAETIDLLVTDHMMPGMTGVELARATQAMRPGILVLIVSGYAEVDGLAPDLPRLAKPFRQTDLAHTLSHLEREALTA